VWVNPRSCFCWTNNAGAGSSPESLPIISARKDSFGATPSTTGTLFAEPAIVGASTACAPCWLKWTFFGWIISARSRRHGMCRRAHQQHNPVNGYRAQAPSSSARCGGELGGLPFIVEDPGVITPDVCALRDHFHLPGTRVLQFAFDGSRDNPYLPDRYVSNTVVYTGTHDNNTTRGWYKELPDRERQELWNYLKRPAGHGEQAAPALMHLAWSSPASLAIAPLQDLLNLGEEARMNVPGRAQGNWCWRSTKDMLSAPAFQGLRDLTSASRRLAVVESPGSGLLTSRKEY